MSGACIIGGILAAPFTAGMAIVLVVEFSNGVNKIRKIFA